MSVVTVNGVEEVRQLSGEIGKTAWREVSQMITRTRAGTVSWTLICVDRST